MTRRRLYIQREEGKPEFDLWLELDNRFAAVPEIRMCYDGREGKATILTLTTATVTRLNAALTELLDLCSVPFDDYVPEETASDD